MLVDQLTVAYIRRACTSTYYTRGLQYQRQGMVLDVEFDEKGDMIHAEVEGSRSCNYDVVIHLSKHKGGIDIQGYCSCPMHYNCKHVAAVLIDVLEENTAKRAQSVARVPAPADPLTVWQQKTLELIQPPSGFARSSSSEQLVYLLKCGRTAFGIQCWCETVKSRRLKSGAWGKSSSYDLRNLSQWYSPPNWLQATDLAIAPLLLQCATMSGRIDLKDDFGHLAILRMLATGRCYYGELSAAPLQHGTRQHVHFEWQSEADGQRLKLTIDGLSEEYALLPTDPPLYLDFIHNRCGELDQPLPTTALLALTQLPLVPPRQQQQLSLFLSEHFPAHSVPLPVELTIQSADNNPVPVLCLMRRAASEQRAYHVLRVNFYYAPLHSHPAVMDNTTTATQLVEYNGEHWRLTPDVAAEVAILNQLGQFGFRLSTGMADVGEFDLVLPADTIAQSVAGWKRFIDQIPLLQQQGWQIRIDDSFMLQFETAASMDFHVDEGQGDWFELGLNLDYNGQRIPLLPLLTGWLERSSSDEPLLVELENGRWLHCPETLIAPVIETLVELFAGPALNSAGQLKLHRSQVYQLNQLEKRLSPQLEDLRWSGAQRLRELAGQLNQFDGIRAVSPPGGLRATLRDYQSEGLNWLQFLREYQFNGILADDMGLGKTLQTLAHLLVEKQAGRLTTAALIVAPTSVLGNWQREVQRFTPELRVLILHGLQRQSHFEHIADFDLIITSYALLNRDQDFHTQQCYHALILDEAQAIKNPASKVAQIASQIPAQQRLCLTGTPVENHLGELWSLFHFLMPGFLGSQKHFNQLFRKPIEQQGNAQRQNELQRRLLPFVLRRDKQQVASELPAKTTILCPVEFGAAQARLYETVRSAMSKKVRQLLEKKGLKNSQIEILDALLKLRQACCDPRLVKLESAKKVKGSAKLEQLLEMLEQLLEEGRKILLFSQFTSMLSLIEQELVARAIRYVKLTGRTIKRDEVISSFQDGDVPLFLISLKAGGTGLNLTAADTVIHYDPWWNPAVENQATDRAHRIGQDKPVFVYKLIAQGTLEEKIVQLQEKKQRIADGVYAEGRDDEVSRLTGEDLLALFES